MARNDAGRLLHMSPAEIDKMEWVPEPGRPGVLVKTLWVSGQNYCGLMRVEEGHDKPVHVHNDAHHQIWVLGGSAVMCGKQLTPGTYLYVPAGKPHGITEVADGGLVYFFTHRTLSAEDDINLGFADMVTHS